MEDEIHPNQADVGEQVEQVQLDLRFAESPLIKSTEDVTLRSCCECLIGAREEQILMLTSEDFNTVTISSFGFQTDKQHLLETEKSEEIDSGDINENSQTPDRNRQAARDIKTDKIEDIFELENKKAPKAKDQLTRKSLCSVKLPSCCDLSRTWCKKW